MDRSLIKIIDAIQRCKSDFAVGAVTHPKTDGDITFEYGRVCGYSQGLSEALRLINQILKREEEDHG